MYLFSPSMRGFYLPEIHGAGIPADVVPVSAEDHAALIAAQAAGSLITVGPDGGPIAVAPPEPTPAEALAAERAGMVVSRFQARAALHVAGLLQTVEAAVTAANPLTQIAWADAQEFRRNSPTIVALAAALDLDDETLDQLFRDAAQISA